MYNRNLFITGVCDTAAQDERWIQMKFNKELLFNGPLWSECDTFLNVSSLSVTTMPLWAAVSLKRTNLFTRKNGR